MKICILADDFPPHVQGGAGTVAAAVARGYVARGHAVTVITSVEDPSLAGFFEEEGMGIERVYSNYAPIWRAWKSLYNADTVPLIRRVLATAKPDVVHVHNIHHHLSYHALKLAKQSGAKVLLTAHDCMLFHYGKFVEYIDPADTRVLRNFNYKISAWTQLATYRKRYNPLRNWVIRHYLRYVDTVCAVSRSLQEALAANGIPGAVVVHNGLDLVTWDAWAEKDASLDVPRGFEGKSVVGFVGKMSGAKGGHQMLRAFRELHDRVPTAVLLVIGAGDSVTPSARALIQELGLTEAVIVTGRLQGPELVAAYRACTVVAFPSVCLDTFGMVNVEAMATGKPVVATCFGGSPEVVLDGVTGTIINPYDVGAFGHALETFLRNPEKSKEYGVAGVGRAREHFSLDRQLDQYIDLMRPD